MTTLLDPAIEATRLELLQERISFHRNAANLYLQMFNLPEADEHRRATLQLLCEYHTSIRFGLEYQLLVAAHNPGSRINAIQAN